MFQIYIYLFIYLFDSATALKNIFDFLEFKCLKIQIILKELH